MKADPCTYAPRVVTLRDDAGINLGFAIKRHGEELYRAASMTPIIAWLDHYWNFTLKMEAGEYATA